MKEVDEMSEMEEMEEMEEGWESKGCPCETRHDER
jgi:hypothetical protein